MLFSRLYIAESAISAPKSDAMHCIIDHDPANWLQHSWSHGPRFVLVEDGSHSHIDLELECLASAKMFRTLFLWARGKEENRWK